MLTTMEEDVLELCTSTVTNTPMTSPATGLASTTLSWKMSPAALPVHTQTASGRKRSTPYTLRKTWRYQVIKANVQRWVVIKSRDVKGNSVNSFYLRLAGKLS